MTVIDTVGWAATALVVLSYFSVRQQRLRMLQMLAAVVWTAYGVAIGASPVIVANVLVFSAAGWTVWRGRRAPPGF